MHKIAADFFLTATSNDGCTDARLSCSGCISKFQDCVLCGADIQRIDDDPHLQGLVEKFIEGHARIKRPTVQANGELSPVDENKSSNVVSYEDVSLARGSFLIQHALRVSLGLGSNKRWPQQALAFLVLLFLTELVLSWCSFGDCLLSLASVVEAWLDFISRPKSNL
jgi:hypothetical protein